MFRVWFVTPDKGRQRTFLFHEFLSPLCIVDDSLNFPAMADDPFVIEQPIKIRLSKACYSVEIETMESGTEILAFGQDSSPTQP